MTNDAGGTARDDESTDEHVGNWRQVAQRHFDPEQDLDLPTVLVYAIADAKDIPPDELKSPPLYDVVDATAIQDTFFGPSADGTPQQGGGSVKFRYDTLLVNVDSDGWIQVYEMDETASP